MSNKPLVLKAIDICDKYVVHKTLIASIPFRMIIVGSSNSGKSSILSCAVALPSWYGNDFKGDDIYVFSGSPGDNKMSRLIAFKEIPATNIFYAWNDAEVSMIYNEMVEKWNEDVKNNIRPANKLFVIDDLGFTNTFRSESKKNDMMNKLFSNARKYNGSVILSVQKYSSISTPVRESANCLISFSATNKQMDLIETDWNYLPNKKDFDSVFRRATEEKFSFIYINLDNPISTRYLDKNFDSLYPEKK